MRFDTFWVVLVPADGSMTVALVAAAGRAESVADGVAEESSGKVADANVLLLVSVLRDGSAVAVAVESATGETSAEGPAAEPSLGGGRLPAFAAQAGGDTGTAVGNAASVTNADGEESVAVGSVSLGSTSDESVAVGVSVGTDGSEESVGVAASVADGKDVSVADTALVSVAEGNTAEAMGEADAAGSAEETSAVALATLESVALGIAVAVSETTTSAVVSTVVSSRTK